MSEIQFFTAITFDKQSRSHSQHVLEIVDGYFYLRGKQACVISGDGGAVLVKNSLPCFITAVKIISYFTLVIPIAMLIAKVILRSMHHFHFIETANPSTASIVRASLSSPTSRIENIPHLDLNRALNVPISVPSSPSPTPLLPSVLPIVKENTVPIVSLPTPLENSQLLASRQSWENAKQKLEEGIHISASTIIKLQELNPRLCLRENNPEIIKYDQARNVVFSLASMPDIIFKIPHSAIFKGDPSEARGKVERRFANMIKAKQLCLEDKLDLLVIPHAKMLEVEVQGKKVLLIAEECIKTNSNESAQEDLYRTISNETVRQLIFFIKKTGLSDVNCRNVLLFENSSKVALVDLEEMQKAIFGLSGLIHCLFSEEQIDTVVAQAQCDYILDSKVRRLRQIRLDQELQGFYAEKGVLQNPRQHITVDDLNSLGLNLQEQEFMLQKTHTPGTGQKRFERVPISMGKVILDVIALINDAIDKAPENASTKGKRYILLSTTRGILKTYDRFGSPKGDVFDNHQRWLDRIIEALERQKHIFRLVIANGHGYFIQA